MSELAGLPSTTTPVHQRVAYLDNARYWVMLLVVVGHFLTRLLDMDSARGTYTWIYSFHMPFFILISGYTARRYMGDFRQVRRMVSTLIIPYLLVETALQLITQRFENSPKHLQVLSPQWLGWFIAALVVWRLTTPIWRALRYPITTSIIISLVVGLFHVPNVLSLSKVLGFLPFYVVGLHMSRERFNQLADMRIRAVAVVLLLGSFVVCQLYASRWTTAWLLFKQNYSADPLNASPMDGLITRTLLLIIGFTLAFAVLALIPRRRSWTTRLGQRTFYCYLLHGFIILGLDFGFSFWDEIASLGGIAVIGCVVLALLLGNLLMTKPFEVVFRPLFQPRLNWIFRQAAEAPIEAPTKPAGSPQ